MGIHVWLDGMHEFEISYLTAHCIKYVTRYLKEVLNMVYNKNECAFLKV